MIQPTLDVQELCSKDTLQEERRNLGVGDIYTNAAKCLGCGDTIRSRNRHDFVTCTCGNVSVDGGSWYARRSFKPDGPGFEDIIEPYDDVQDEEE